MIRVGRHHAPRGTGTARLRRRPTGRLALVLVLGAGAGALIGDVVSGAGADPVSLAAPATGSTGDTGTGANTGATGNTGNPSTPPGGTTVTTSTLPPAPAGYAASLTSLYTDMYATVAATGIAASEPPGSPLIPSDTQFSQLITQLTPAQLAALYDATSQTSGWDGLDSTYQSLTAVANAQPVNDIPMTTVPSSGAGGSTTSTTTTGSSGSTAAGAASLPAARHSMTAGAAAAHIVTRSAAHSAALTATPSPFPPTEPTGSFPAPPQPYQPSSPIAPTQVPSCPAPAPGDTYGETSIYAATVAADVIDAAKADLPDEFNVPVQTAPFSIDVTVPDPALVALAAAAGAAHVIADTFQFEQNYWGNCLQNNWGTYLTNIDNTTVNTYDLLTLMESTLDNVESSVNTVSAQVGVVQQTEDDQLTLQIQQALTAPAGTPPAAGYEEPASAGGILDSTPIGVQEVVTSDLAAAQAAGLPVNPAANQDLAAANAALAAANDKVAYADYHAAYLEVAQ